MKRNIIARLFALMAAIILFAAPARAQSTATVQGTVVDTQNAAIPGTTVVVRNTATGLTRTLVTDAKEATSPHRSRRARTRSRFLCKGSRHKRATSRCR